MAERPTGTVTFLFTDVEGSTALWEQHREEMQQALERHDQILRSAIEGHGGYVFSTAGDAFAAAFSRTADAVETAIVAQQDLAAESWPVPTLVRVRMGLHTGEAQERDGDYFGPVLNRAARIMSAGHGGQILVSASTASLVDATTLQDLGEHRLKDLSAKDRLYQVGDSSFPALRSLETVRHNLPVERTPLVGRREDIEEVAELVARHRLVTLLGIGGTGKTRLATAIAAEVADQFGDGVWFVDLVPAAGAEQVAEAIATAAGLSVSGSDLVEALAELIAGREMLVVLDNCEHVTDDVAEVVDVLLESTTGPRFVATSREPLQLLDERHVHVAPLAVDSNLTGPAVELFTATAERVGVTVEAEEAEAIARICIQLDGLPLALELAAAQLRQYTVAELADRLDQRFELLAQGRRGRRRRQASLQAVLEDTWKMLDDHEHQLLLLLAAFPSGFAAQDVEQAVVGLDVGPVGRTLAGLVDRSLVARDNDGRHRLLETVKVFAQQRWAESPAPDQYIEQHTAWVLNRLRLFPIEDHYTSYEVAGWANEHYDDHRAVEDRLADSGRTNELAELLSMLAYTYNVATGLRGSALIDRLQSYLQQESVTDVEAGFLNLSLAMVTASNRRFDLILPATEIALRSLDEENWPAQRAMALIVRTWATYVGGLDDAIADLRQAVTLAETVGAAAVANIAVGFEAIYLSGTEDLEAARRALADLASRIAGRGYDFARFGFLINTISVEVIDNPDTAAEAAVTMLEHQSAALGEANVNWIVRLIHAFGIAATGDIPSTRLAMARTETSVRNTATDNGLPDLLLPLALIAHALGDHARARRWLTAMRHTPIPYSVPQSPAVFKRLRTSLGLDDDNPLDATTIEDIYEEATDWLATL